MERHFSTSDAVDAGEGGIRLACVCFTDSLDGFDLHRFHPLQGFQKGQRTSTEKKRSLGEKEKQALGRRDKNGPELLSRGSWHIGEEALRRFKRLEKS